MREDELHRAQSLRHQKRSGNAFARDVPDREVGFVGTSHENIVEISADIRRCLIVGCENSSRDAGRNRAREHFLLDVARNGEIPLDALLRPHAFECAQLPDGGGGEICISSESFKLLFVEALSVARVEYLEHAYHFTFVFKRSA